MMQRMPSLFVADSKIQGKGVFTSDVILKDSLLEICPIILVPPNDMPLLVKTELYNYYFEWGDDDKSGAIALGFGSIYNHSYSPNAYYEVNYETAQIMVYAFKDLSAGDEICFNYNGSPEIQDKVWFDKY